MKSTNKIHFIIGAAAVITAITLGVLTRHSKDTDSIYALRFADYNGEAVHLSDFKHKPMVLNMWASWCPFCKKELIDLATAQKEYGNQVLWWAVNRAEPVEAAKTYWDTLKITNALTFLHDPDDLLYKTTGGFAMPETIFVDQGGSIFYHKRGQMTLKEIRQRTNELLKTR